MKFDLIQGRTDEQLRTLLDAAHQAMVQAFDVPVTDRYQSVTQHRPGELVLEDTGLGYPRSKDVVLLTAVSRKRTEAQKIEFYRLLVENLHTKCGISPDDVIVSIVENGDADWSFGR
ncbi:tautomerase family protein, partial [Burkholderia cenocepacia]|uniref:tautomerase family protein n=1 Tax=Burkholderia cenocepacia TaxID=95486 RepID=UPI00222EF066